MTSHEVCTSRTSQVLTVASLQRLKMEALIPPPAELWSAVCDEVFECTEHSADQNSSSPVPAVISRIFSAPWCTKLLRSTCSGNCAPPGKCQGNWHQNTKQSAWSQHFHNDGEAEMTVTQYRGYNPRRQTATTQGYKSWSHSMTNVQQDPRYEMSVTQWFQSQVADFYHTGIQTLVPRYDKCLTYKNSSTLAVSFPINLTIKLGFVSVNGARETYFVDMLHNTIH